MSSLSESLAVALQSSRKMSESEDVLVIMAQEAAIAGDDALMLGDVRTYTQQAKWLRQLMKDLRLLEVEEVPDDDDDPAAVLFAAPEGPASV